MDSAEEKLHVGPMEAIMSGVMTIFSNVMIIAAVWKLFQMASDLGEIKTLLTEMRRTTPGPVSVPLPVAGPVPPVPLAPTTALVVAAPAPASPPPPTVTVTPPATVAPVVAAPAQVPAPPSIMAGPISLESAEALLREIEAESHALEEAERAKTTV